MNATGERVQIKRIVQYRSTLDRLVTVDLREEKRMSRFKRTLLGVSIAAAFGVPLTFAGLAAGAGKINIAVFYYNPSPYGIASYKAAIAEAKKLGGISITTFDANNDPTAQNTQMTDAITTGKYKGFWVWALNGVAEAPVIKQAEAKHIKVAVADYTLGDLNAQLTLKPTKGLVTTIGSNIGVQEQAFATLLEQACTAKVGATGTCNVAFMPGLANYPTDTLRLNYFQGVFPSNIKLNILPPGDYDQATAQQVALTYFQSKPDIQVFGSFGDQMTAGAETAMQQDGITPGKDILLTGSGATNETVAQIKSGAVFGSVALYPSTESYIAIKDLVTAIKGGKVPTTVNVIDKNHPLIITAKTLKTAKGFKPDWSLTGNPG
jgi:ABC-type sugar transport system substrate-binding protein